MKIFFQLTRFARGLIFACVVSTALALTVVRFWLLPRAADWREELQANIGAMLGETVHIKTLSAGMRGFKPELLMRGFRIENAAQDGPSLEFERLGVGLDVWASVLAKKPVIGRIDLEGSRLRLLRQADGKLALAGLKPGGSPLWLFAEGEVRFFDIDLELADASTGPAMALGRVQARLRNRGGSHLLDLRLDLPGKLGKSVRVSADIEGNPLQSKDWQGRAYLEAKRLREGAFAESLPVRLRSGELGFQVWGEWRGGVFSEAVARLDFDRPVFSWSAGPGRQEGLFSLDRLAGWLRWRQEDKGWRVDVRHFALARNGKTWPESDFAFAVGRTADGGLDSLRAAFGYLRLEESIALLGSLPIVDPRLYEQFKTLAPRGEIRDASLVYQAPGRVGFCGRLSGLAFNSPPDWPSLKHFDGRICGNDRDGQAELGALKAELNLSGLFPKPITIEHLRGQFVWSRSGSGLSLPPRLFEPEPRPPEPEPITVPTAEQMALLEAAASSPPPPPPPPPPFKLFADSAWRIAGNQVKLAAPGLAIEGGFALDWPAEGGGSPSVDLNLRLKDVELAKLRDYLPVSAMSPAAAQWHGSAYQGGRLASGELVVRGRLADFPFPQGEGLFEAHGDFENVELNFNPAWPHVNGAKVKALFFGPAMFVDSEGGRIGDIPLKTVHAQAGTFSGDSWVDITGGLDLNLANALKFMQQTPLRFIPQRLAKVLDATGEARLDLKLQVPVSAGDTKTLGFLQLKNAALALKDINLTVQELNGGLAIVGSGVEGMMLSAKALGEPVSIDVAQRGDNLLLDIDGRASVGALRKAIPKEFWERVEGDFTYALNLQLPKSLDANSDTVRIDLASDLAGLELKLPPPLEKPAAAKKDFSASVQLRRGQEAAVRLSYGREGMARLLFSTGEALTLQSGDVFWNKPQIPSSGAPGLGLYMKLDSFELGAWRRLLAEAGLGTASIMPHGLDVEVDKLLWDGEDLGALDLTGKSEGGELFGEVDFKYGKGSYVLSDPEYGHPSLKLDLERLTLPQFPDDKAAAGQAAPDPATLPILQVRAHHLIRQDVDLGAFDLDTDRWTYGMNIKHLGLTSENHALDLKGSWMRQEGRDETKLQGRLKVNDLGRFLTLLGYGKEIQYTPTESQFSLTWPAAPHLFSSGIVAGEVRLKLGRGSVLQVDPGLGRALGMLNLQTLRRLLVLDFNDLFGKGLAYDSMEGVFQLGSGQARTKGFVIDAVAADILILGRVGLADHDFDQTVSVMPHTVASIPLAGALVGQAAVGAVIDLANRLVGREDVNFASTNYSVTGTWDNPQIKRIQGNIPLEMINRAWSGFKDLSGMENSQAPDKE